MLDKYYNCNNCARQCNGDIQRDKRGSLKKTISCPGWQKPYEMRVSLLERASENVNSWSALNVILDKLDMTFHETHKYPFFTFQLN